MKKIIIVRGPTLNKWEIQNYEPLANYFSISAIGGKPKLSANNEILMPISYCWSPAKYFMNSRIKLLIANAIWGSPYYLIGLKNKLKTFDIVNTVETFNPATLAALNSKLKNPKQKLVITVWENVPFQNEGRLTIQNYIKKRALKEADHFITTSERARESLIIEGAKPENISTVMMGINLNNFRPERKDQKLLKLFNLSPQDFIVLTIARHTWEKGIHDLILAFKKINLNKNCKLLIVGDGPYHDKLVLLTKKLKIFNNVRFVKNIDYKTIPKIHNLADLFVLSSIPVPGWQEQFGMVLIESMACGKAVISTLSGSIPEVIGNCGMLVPPADSYELAKQLEVLYKDQKLRKNLGDESRKRALELFDANKVSEKIKEVFLKVSNQN